jgi:uncharacterized membrane protein YedE/YeeE
VASLAGCALIGVAASLLLLGDGRIALGVSGMTRPAKVLAFLNVTGAWDPSLAFVMVGEIAVHASAVPWILRRRAPLFADRFSSPTRTDVDHQLIVS